MSLPSSPSAVWRRRPTKSRCGDWRKNLRWRSKATTQVPAISQQTVLFFAKLILELPLPGRLGRPRTGGHRSGSGLATAPESFLLFAEPEGGYVSVGLLQEVDRPDPAMY